MKKIKCADLGIHDCAFEAFGETHEEIVNQVLDHTQNDHSKLYDSMSDEEIDTLTSQIKDMLEKQD